MLTPEKRLRVLDQDGDVLTVEPVRRYANRPTGRCEDQAIRCHGTKAGEALAPPAGRETPGERRWVRTSDRRNKRHSRRYAPSASNTRL